MAEKNRQILQHLRTTGNTAYVQENLKSKAAQGEIAIQYDGTEASGTSLWTLAKDGQEAVQFVNKEQVADMIKNGAVAEVDKIEQAIYSLERKEEKKLMDFKLSDEQKNCALWRLLNEDGKLSYSICAVYDDYCVVYNNNTDT